MKRHTTLFRHARRGLTLVEIVVVIALLGILMTIIGGSLMGVFDENAADATKLQMRKLSNELQVYALKHKGKYPTSAEGLEASKRYFPDKRVPKDAWGNEFKYFSPGTHSDADFELVSFGKDGREGGDEVDADIKSWELE